MLKDPRLMNPDFNLYLKQLDENLRQRFSFIDTVKMEVLDNYYDANINLSFRIRLKNIDNVYGLNMSFSNYALMRINSLEAIFRSIELNFIDGMKDIQKEYEVKSYYNELQEKLPTKQVEEKNIKKVKI